MIYSDPVAVNTGRSRCTAAECLVQNWGDNYESDEDYSNVGEKFDTNRDWVSNIVSIGIVERKYGRSNYGIWKVSGDQLSERHKRDCSANLQIRIG
mgnify:CR=1 FL=1